MTSAIKAVVASALKLPEKDRVLAAREILLSLEEDDPTAIDAAWKAEIVRRLREMRRGKTKWKSGDEVLKALKQKYQQ